MLINPWNRKGEFLDVYDMQTEPGVIPKKFPFPSKQEKTSFITTNVYYSGEKNQSREFVMTSLWMLVDLVKVQTTDWDHKSCCGRNHNISYSREEFLFLVAHKEIKFDVVLIWRWVLITKEFKLHTLKPDSALGVLYLRCFRTFTSSN